MNVTKTKPNLSLPQIINMSIGFLGIQFGFALQNGNASRILLTFGANIENLSWFWLAAPLTGMVIQPIIGYYSDRTWSRWGRRKPFFFIGALLASTALLFMPNAAVLAGFLPALFIGAGILMLMDASFNVAMEPFRALVADNLPEEQSTLGFSIQTALIGFGAIVGSGLPYIFAEWFGIAKTAADGQVPDNVVFSFYTGAIVFMGAILWTLKTTKEYSPQEREFFGVIEEKTEASGIFQVLNDIKQMPTAMKQLGAVQFFSWAALFSMWVYTTPAIAQHIYGLPIADHSSEAFQTAGNWVGIMFLFYNVSSTLYALLLPSIARKIGRKNTHAFSLMMGGLGLLSMYAAPNPEFLLVSMIGIGIAWASILAMPYAILSVHIPTHKMGIYMGIFNIFITFPQILNGIFGGIILKHFFHENAIYSIVLAGAFMLIGAVSVLIIDDKG